MKDGHRLLYGDFLMAPNKDIIQDPCPLGLLWLTRNLDCRTHITCIPSALGGCSKFGTRLGLICMRRYIQMFIYSVYVCIYMYT